MHLSRMFMASAGALALALAAPASGQNAPAAAPPAASAAPAQRQVNPQMAASQAATQADHRKMLDLLGIQSLRPGLEGMNKSAPNFANYDEAKANPYPKLPEVLTLNNGKKVKDAKTWWNQRRPEIVELFDREVYGRMPKNMPKVKWEVLSVKDEENGGVAVVTKTLVGHVDSSAYPAVTVDIQLSLSTPKAAQGPVPVIMEFGMAPGFNAARAGGPAPAAGRAGAAPAAGRMGMPGAGGPGWQQQVLARGWGYAAITPGSIQADNGAGLTSGIVGLMNKGQSRKVDDWGALKAWAWGAGRALDYFETDKAVNAKMVGLEGHSRYGKATLVAMAYDQRFAVAFVSSAGEGGPKLHRRNWGEIIENVAAPSEYHWMAGNFMKYAGPLNWNDLPVDSHELIAMCAPRPVFLSAGKGGYDAEPGGDSWADAKGTFMAGAAASPVYELLGRKGMSSPEYPPMETGVMGGDVAFRQHSGGHTAGPNWPVFLDFAARYIKTK